MVFAVETYCPASDGYLGGADRGGGDPDADGPEGDFALSGAGAADRQSVLEVSARCRASSVQPAVTRVERRTVANRTIATSGAMVKDMTT